MHRTQTTEGAWEQRKFKQALNIRLTFTNIRPQPRLTSVSSQTHRIQTSREARVITAFLSRITIPIEFTLI